MQAISASANSSVSEANICFPSITSVPFVLRSNGRIGVSLISWTLANAIVGGRVLAAAAIPILLISHTGRLIGNPSGYCLGTESTFETLVKRDL